MKILVVCQYYYPEPFRITNICETLVSRGHDVTVLTGLPNYPSGIIFSEYRNGNKREEYINGVKIIRSYEIGRGKSKIKLFLNYFSFALSGSLKTLFMKDKYDVVFVNQLSPIMMALPAIIYKKKNNKKILLYCLDLWPDSLAAGGIKKDSFAYKIFLRISRWIYKSSDLILITSSMFEKYFREIICIKDKDIIHLPQYAEDLFLMDGRKPLKINKESKEFNFVFAGNIGDMQSVDTIIRSANELKTVDYIKFHIIGDGSKLSECKLLSNEQKLNNITFYGRKPIEDMPEFYDMADAMLITLKDNDVLSMTLPGKIQSYMAAGKPIIGAINGETKVTIDKAKCGIVCKAEDYKSLSKIIIEFINYNNKEQMGKNAYKFYIENYTKDKFITRLENALLDLEAQNVQ